MVTKYGLKKLIYFFKLRSILACYILLYLICYNLDTFPQGDIFLEKGSDLNITCVLNRKFASKFGPSPSRLLSFSLGENPVPVSKWFIHCL